MRAVVQGVDPTAAWNRYLHNEAASSDPRVIRSTIAWIRDEFSAAAQRHARFGVARLVRLDTARLATAGQARIPPLEDFASQRGLLDFSEAEQIEAYEAEYGQHIRRARRRRRLVERQLEALGWLESLVGQAAYQPASQAVAALAAPQASDSVARWINPVLARPLQKAGIHTLGGLIDRINGIGQRWHGPIRGVGPAKAERIMAWLRDHEASLAASGAARLGGHLDRPRSRLHPSDLAAVPAANTGIRPLEKLNLPPTLDGSQGLYRQPADQCLLAVRDDRAAVLAWVKAKASDDPGQSAEHTEQSALRPESHITPTQRSYRKEAERLLLWAVHERGKPLSSLDAEDWDAYRAFLADPQPRGRWCGPRSRERWSPLWRPFEGPLGPDSQRQALRVVRSLFNFLERQRYVGDHPWSTIRVPGGTRPPLNASRGFNPEQWRFIQQRLAALPETALHLRLRFAVRLLYATGLRLSEALAARVDDLVQPKDAESPAQTDAVWQLRVAGRGARVRTVPIPRDIIELAEHAFEARGYSPDLFHASNRGRHLLQALEEGALAAVTARRRKPPAAGTTPSQAGMSANTLYRQLKAFFTRCAELLQAQGDTEGASRLRLASVHWLRHTHACHALAAGLPLAQARRNLGHAARSTTSAYLRSDGAQDSVPCRSLD